MIFWNWRFFFRLNSKRKEVLLTRTPQKVMFSWMIWLLHVKKFAGTCRLWLSMYDVVFFCSAFYMLCTMKVGEVGAFFHGLITKAEFQNRDEKYNQLKLHWNLQVPWWNQKVCVRFNLLFLFKIFVLLKLDFPWNHFVTQNVLINIFLPTHPPKMSGWHFAWQNGYGHLP